MTVQDVAVVVIALSTLGILGWAVYQTIALKKDVDLLGILKELEVLYDGVGKILDELEVDDVDKALTEIRLLKGIPPEEPVGQIMEFQKEEGEWRQDAKKGSYWVPFAKPVEKK